MNIVLCDAIREHRLVRFVYAGYERIVEPYTYGTTRSGRELLMGWLARGWSRSEPTPGWRTFHVDEMRDIAAMAEPFAGTRAGYRGGGRRFEQVYCEAALPTSATTPPAEIGPPVSDESAGQAY
jgi:predicted DNA-binding transcriptional regulator YafY